MRVPGHWKRRNLPVPDMPVPRLVRDSEWHVDPGWRQGRGAWGGLTITRMANAVSQIEDPARTIRTLSAQILEPVTAGDYLVSVECLRAGSAMSTWNVAVRRQINSELVAQGQVITGSERVVTVTPELSTWGTATMPVVEPWESVAVAPVGPPFAPEFTARLEFRPITPLPTAGDTSGAIGWINIPDSTTPGNVWTAPELMGIIDGWWPATYTLMDSMHPMATVAFTVHLLIDPAEIAPINGERSPLLHEASVSSAYGGFTSELRRLWTPDGRLVAENLQSIVIIK